MRETFFTSMISLKKKKTQRFCFMWFRWSRVDVCKRATRQLNACENGNLFCVAGGNVEMFLASLNWTSKNKKDNSGKKMFFDTVTEIIDRCTFIFNLWKQFTEPEDNSRWTSVLWVWLEVQLLKLGHSSSGTLRNARVVHILFTMQKSEGLGKFKQFYFVTRFRR
jgi:hypothetical protein